MLELPSDVQVCQTIMNKLCSRNIARFLYEPIPKSENNQNHHENASEVQISLKIILEKLNKHKYHSFKHWMDDMESFFYNAKKFYWKNMEYTLYNISLDFENQYKKLLFREQAKTPQGFYDYTRHLMRKIDDLISHPPQPLSEDMKPNFQLIKNVTEDDIENFIIATEVLEDKSNFLQGISHILFSCGYDGDDMVDFTLLKEETKILLIKYAKEYYKKIGVAYPGTTDQEN